MSLDTLDVDLGLQLAAGSCRGRRSRRGCRARAPRAMLHRPGQDLEALLVLDVAPRHDERPASPARRTGGRRPQAGSTPLGMRSTWSASSSKPVMSCSTMKRVRCDQAVGLEREPPLDRVDVGRIAERELAAVAHPLGAVHGEHERHADGSWRACRRPSRSASRGRARCRAASHRGPGRGRELRSELDERVVGRRRAGDRVDRRQPRQIDRGAAARRDRRRPARSSARRSVRRCVSTTTSWPARARPWSGPSTWAAVPPVARGGKSHDSISTRTAWHPTGQADREWSTGSRRRATVAHLYSGA